MELAGVARRRTIAQFQKRLPLTREKLINSYYFLKASILRICGGLESERREAFTPKHFGADESLEALGHAI